MSIEQQSGSHAANHVSANDNQPVLPAHEAIDPSHSPSNSQPTASDSENKTPQDWRRFLQPDWVIVYVTIANVLVAIFMWRAIRRQANLMETQANEARESTAQAITIAREAADASKVQATTAMGVAVPTLILAGFDFAEKQNGLEKILQNPEMRVVVKNCGQTPAILKTYGLKYSCEGLNRTGPIPVAWVFEDGEVIEPGREYILKDAVYTPWDPFTEEETSAIVAGRKTLSVAGCLRFGDVFGSPLRELRFCKDLAEFGSDLRSLWVDSDLGIQFGAWTEKKQS